MWLIIWANLVNMILIARDPFAQNVGFARFDSLAMLVCPCFERFGHMVLKVIGDGEVSFALDGRFVLKAAESLPK